MKYILIILLTILSVYPQADSAFKRKVVRKWLKQRPWKGLAFWFAFGIGIWAAVDLWRDDDEHKIQRKEDQSTIQQLRTEITHSRTDQQQTLRDLENTRAELRSAHEKIARQNELLVEQERSIIAQNRTIDSIAYNTQTTLDGKKRFIRCFKDLSRLTDLKNEGACFEGLVCDDGVAMYWFDAKNDLLTGFHFFPNDELNRVLSGMPMDENCVDANGRLIVQVDSELAIALNEALSRKTPPRSDSGPMKERADEIIVAELSTLFRYVYRAQHSRFDIAYFKGTRKTAGTRFLTFQYLVNPFVEKPHLRTVSHVKLSATFMRSLYGVSIAEFSQRVIAECRRLGIEPKVRRTDVRQLNAIRVRDEEMSNSPFRKLHKEGN